MSTFNFIDYIENNTLRLEATRRGGGIEIDASEYLGLPGARMTAYQNYLGGGMLGSVQSDRNFYCNADRDKLNKAHQLAEALKRYFYQITNAEAMDWDEWGATDNYEAQQTRPGSGY